VSSIFGARQYILSEYQPMMEMGKIHPTLQSLTRHMYKTDHREKEGERQMAFQKSFSISGGLKTCKSLKVSGSICSQWRGRSSSPSRVSLLSNGYRQFFAWG
jgi:hypothetical protein